MPNYFHTLVAALLTAGCSVALAASATAASGGVDNTTLVSNQDVAKVQAASTISTFMTKGAQTCDSNGQNCHSVFGADDSVDYSSLQQAGQSLTGVSAFSYLDPGGSEDGGNSNAVAAQLGTLALACGDDKVHKVAGIAVKLTKCSVSANGDAQVTVQVCSAPARGNPVTAPDNQVECSSDATAPNFTAPAGFVCKRPACDSELVGSLNGWSAPQAITFTASLPVNASDDTKSKNGLGLVFYPPLTAGALASFTADSDNMTAVKIVQTFVNNDTGATAVGLKIAYRHKTQVTKDMMLKGASAVPNPGEHTAQWDTIDKLQGNASIPQYQQKYGGAGSACLQQINQGLAGDGTVSVCDPNYNKDGVKPIAKTAQIAVEGQACSTTPQCLKQVVNTTTWQESCQADVPLALRTCTTQQAYTTDHLNYTRTRSKELCHESRAIATYSCDTYVRPEQCQRESLITVGGIDLQSQTSDSNVVLVEKVDDVTNRYRIGAVGDNYWPTGYYRREFVVDIKNVSEVAKFRIYQVGYDDELAIAVNNQWVWSEYGGGGYNPATDTWGRWIDVCQWGLDADGAMSWCATTTREWQTYWERNTSWVYNIDVDVRSRLQEGRNVIRMDTGVYDGGEGFVYLEISAWRAKCEYPVYNDCAPYEAAK